MTHKNALDRTALTAISTALALMSTSALAQTAQPVAPPVLQPQGPSAALPDIGQIMPSTPPADGAGTAQTAPVFKPQAPVVQQLPEDSAKAPASAPATTAADRPPATARASATPAAAPRSASSASNAPTSTSPLANTPAPAPAASSNSATASPQMTSNASAPTAPELTDPVSSTPAQPQPASQPGDQDLLYWGLGGAAALLLLGGAAFAMSRRRNGATSDMREADAYAGAYPDTRRAAAPTDRATAPGPTTVASPSAQPAVVMPAVAMGERQGSQAGLEAMVAERPSAANPFLTRKNRLRRANFLLRQGEAPAATAPAERSPAPGIAPQPDRSQQVYDFGKGGRGNRPFWKPVSS